MVDLAEVKERLGLPADTDPTESPGDGLARARLFAYSAGAFPYLVRLERPLMDPPELEVVTRVEGEASADRVEGPPGDAFEAGEAEADGDLARLPLTYRPRAGLQPTQALAASFFPPYRC